MIRQRKNPPANVKLSRQSGVKPKASQLEFGQMAWNVVDGSLYAKILNSQGEEEVIIIAGNGFSNHIESELSEKLKIRVFETLDELNQHLESASRYPGQVALCKEAEGQIFVLSNDMSQWLLAAGNEDYYDKHFVLHITHKLQEVIAHNLGKKPSVEILDEQGNKCIAEVQHLDENTTKISFIDPFSGKVTFN